VLEETLDNHAIVPDPIQLSVPAMRPDLLKLEPVQERPACCVFRKYSAYELVQTPAAGGLDERGKHRPAGSTPAMCPSLVYRELADAGIAGPAAIRESCGEGDSPGPVGFGDHDEVPRLEPLGDLRRCPRLGLESGHPVGDALVVDFRNRNGILYRCRAHR
jgi:hypothetical protein